MLFAVAALSSEQQVRRWVAVGQPGELPPVARQALAAGPALPCSLPSATGRLNNHTGHPGGTGGLRTWVFARGNGPPLKVKLPLPRCEGGKRAVTLPEGEESLARGLRGCRRRGPSGPTGLLPPSAGGRRVPGAAWAEQ